MELLDLNNDDLIPILSFLETKDVCAVSETCTKLLEACLSASSLWRSFSVKKGQENAEDKGKITLTDVERKILEMSDDRICNMHISLNLSRFNFTKNAFDEVLVLLDLLSTAAKKCNLQEFCFEIFDKRKGKSCFRELKWTSPKFLNSCLMLSELIIRLIENCLTPYTSSSARLRTLSLSTNSWATDTLTYKRALLSILRSEAFCERLVSLQLDHHVYVNLRYYRHFWERQNEYETLCTYGEVIGSFKNLQTLEINSIYLTDNLLDALSQHDRVRLQSMTLCVSCFLPREITSWPRLLQSSPSLKVMVHAAAEKFCTGSFVCALPSCVPIVSLRILCIYQTSRDLERMFNLFCEYAQTLESIAFQYGLATLRHSVLMKMITHCTQLHTLYIKGKINYIAILKASFWRERLKLSVSEKDIVFSGNWTDTLHQKANMERLCLEVSKMLGREWKPDSESEEIFRDMFSFIRD